MFKLKFSLSLIFVSVLQFTSVSYSQELSADTVVTVSQQELIPSVDGEIIKQRLSALQSSVPLIYNEYVHSFVDFFTYRKPSFTKTMLERKNYFFPIFEEQLKKYKIPDEIKYLSLIESGLNPKAISYAGAAGLWQFMPRTGRIDFGLRVDNFIDERHHVLKSTEAACKYMKQLYNIFGDWELVLAAYNTGPGNVKRAIRKAGGGGFWQIYPYLHKQTRSYVPQYVAMIYMMHYAADYGICAEQDEIIPNSSPILVSNYLNLNTLASLANIPYDDLKLVNPHIITNELPDNTRNLLLSIPEVNYAYFDENRQMILDSASKRAFPIINRMAKIEVAEDTIGALAVNFKNNKGNPLKDKKSKEFATDEKRVLAETGSDDFEEVANRKPSIKYHIIKKGENLMQIAAKYKVDLYDLKAWNNIKKPGNIKYGKKLKLFLEVAPIRAEVFAKKSRNNEEENLKNNKEEKISKTESKQIFASKTHVVKKGENLIMISNKYNVDIEDIKNWNNLKNSNIKFGQKLKVRSEVSNEKLADNREVKENDHNSSIKPKFHVVLKGDTIWSIAQRYEGSSVDKIRKLNDIRNNNLKPGQKLRVT